MSRTMQDGLMWRCAACGERNFNHYENCVSCGRARPPLRAGGALRHAAVRAGLSFRLQDPSRQILGTMAAPGRAGTGFYRATRDDQSSVCRAGRCDVPRRQIAKERL
jgi:heterodisulfide reductase subunit C